jgi:hypothetical protein
MRTDEGGVKAGLARPRTSHRCNPQPTSRWESIGVLHTQGKEENPGPKPR